MPREEAQEILSRSAGDRLGRSAKRDYQAEKDEREAAAGTPAAPGEVVWPNPSVGNKSFELLR